MNTPWVPMEKIQHFLNIEQQITRDSFSVPIDSDGKTGLPCFIENGWPMCKVGTSSQKGRSFDKSFTQDVTEQLHELFNPFDEYFANEVLHREKFEWNFGLE